MINSATSLMNHPISLAKDSYASATKNKQAIAKGAIAIAGLTAVAAGLYFFGPEMAKYCSATKPAKPGSPIPKPAPAFPPQPTSTTRPISPQPTPTPGPVPTPQNTSTTEPPCPPKSSTLQNIIDYLSSPSPQSSLNQSAVGSPEKVIEALSSREISVTTPSQQNQVTTFTETSFGSKLVEWFSRFLPSTEFVGPPTSDEPIAEIIDHPPLIPIGTPTNIEPTDSGTALQESSFYDKAAEFFSSVSEHAKETRMKRYDVDLNPKEPTWLKSKINRGLTDVWSAASNFEPEQYLAEREAAELENMKHFSSNIRSLGEFISTSASNTYTDCPAIQPYNETFSPSYEMQALEKYEKAGNKITKFPHFLKDLGSHAVSADYPKFAKGIMNLASTMGSNLVAPALTFPEPKDPMEALLQEKVRYEMSQIGLDLVKKRNSVLSFADDVTSQMISADYSKFPGMVFNATLFLGKNALFKFGNFLTSRIVQSIQPEDLVRI